MKKTSVFLLSFFLISSISYSVRGSDLSEVAGKKISLDIKGMDILDVLKLFSMQSGLNIVPGKNVRGTVTIFLKDVDVANAFEILMAANELAYEKEGDIINVMTERDYELIYGRRFHDRTQIKVVHLKYGAAADVAKALTDIKSKVGKIVADERSNTLVILDSAASIAQIEEAIERMDAPARTEVFALNYAKAKDIEPRISELVTKGTGQAKIDERTNKLIVTDTPQKIEEIKKIISSLDARTKEVLIESRIIEISLTKDYAMGVDWKLLLGKELGVQFTSNMAGPFVIGEAAAEKLSLANAGQYTGFLKLLETVGKTDFLSSPRITVINNQEAKILVGSKEAYVEETTTVGEGGKEVISKTVKFVDVGVKLYVTPIINEEGFITMKIKPEISDLKEYKTIDTKSIPIVTTSEAETQVMVKDGSTIVLAGLMRDKTKKDNVTKVPFLGDVPLLGMFFRTREKTTEKTELVILLTPHIITGEEMEPRLARAAIEKEQVIPKEAQEPGLKERFKELFPPPRPAPGVEMAERQMQETLAGIERGNAYSEYYLILSERLMQYVAENYLGLGVKGDAQVFFTLKSDGTLDGEPVVVGEVDPYTKNLAIQCVKSAGPYPRFPPTVTEPRQTFNILLSFSG